MPAFLTLRPLTAAAARAIDRLAHSRTEPARTVERAQIVRRAREGARVPAATVRTWPTRFDAAGVAGLKDAPRSGRPAVYPAAVIGEAIAASLTDPAELGLPCGSWTLDRLTACLQEQKGVGIGRPRIGEVLRAEGLRWRAEETRFGARPDPDVVPKRGRSAPSTRRRLRVASRSASTSWDRRRPKAIPAIG